MHKIIFLAAVCSLFFVNPIDAQNIDKSAYEGLEYRLVGPFRGGRSAAVTGVPNQPNLFYFGATGGGIWKTLDGGVNWQPLSDNHGNMYAYSFYPSPGRNRKKKHVNLVA